MFRFMIRTTEDYDRLVQFMIQYKLEFDAEDEVDTDIVHMWEITQGYRAKDEEVTEQNNYLCGGIILAKREGEYIIDGIAVDPVLRKMGLGKTLVNKAVNEVKKLGGHRIYLVAKAPGFFKKLGFINVGKDEAPNFFECGQCEQYNVDCFPEILKLEF